MKAVKVIVMLCLILIGLGAAAYAFWLRPQIRFAEIGVAYGAKQMCSCLFVAELTEAQCKADLGDDLAVVTFIREDRGVRAEVLGGRISERADYRPGLGCALVPEGA